VALRVVQVVNTAAYYIWVAAVVTAVLLWLAHPSAPGVRPLRGKDPGPA
jgi:hypothetical protein